MTFDMYMLFILFLMIKHYIFDFVYQPPFMYLNKGILGHIGGILHSLLQGIGTFVCVLGFTTNVKVAILFSLFDIFTHYFIDLTKVKINNVLKLSFDNIYYWMLLGLDQLLHCSTYIFITYMLFKLQY